MRKIQADGPFAGLPCTVIANLRVHGIESKPQLISRLAVCHKKDWLSLSGFGKVSIDALYEWGESNGLQNHWSRLSETKDKWKRRWTHSQRKAEQKRIEAIERHEMRSDAYSFLKDRSWLYQFLMNYDHDSSKQLRDKIKSGALRQLPINDDDWCLLFKASVAW